MRAEDSDGFNIVKKPWSFGRRAATAAVAFLSLGFLVFAVAGSNAEGRLAGAGSTLVNPILHRVSTSYQGYLAADRVDPIRQEGKSGDWSAGASALDYDPVGSIGGLTRLKDPAIVFAVTEVPLSTEDLAAEGKVQFPLILGAAAPIANLTLGGAELALDAPALSAIYRGEIVNWSDPAIVALNPGVPLPDQAIAVRYRSDGSGTTWTFTGYLSQAQTWTAGQVAQTAWPVGEGAEGNGGIIAAVKALPGAIGYAEAGQASRAGLSVIRLVNGSGLTVSPSPEAVRAAAASLRWEAGSQTAGSSLAQGWPMTATVYVVMRAKDRGTARALGFFRYFYAEAARQAGDLGYVALPAETVRAIEAYWVSAFGEQS